MAYISGTGLPKMTPKICTKTNFHSTNNLVLIRQLQFPKLNICSQPIYKQNLYFARFFAIQHSLNNLIRALFIMATVLECGDSRLL